MTAPNNCQLPLSNTENRLIDLLTAHAGELLPKPQLLHALYSGEDTSDFHRVEVVLNRLRQKARQLGLMLPIRAVFGKGLVFAARCSRAKP
ncbi:helix-turn-helix domain-containing protein [Thauera mechernichensis]